MHLAGINFVSFIAQICTYKITTEVWGEGAFAPYRPLWLSHCVDISLWMGLFPGCLGEKTSGGGIRSWKRSNCLVINSRPCYLFRNTYCKVSDDDFLGSAWKLCSRLLNTKVIMFNLFSRLDDFKSTSYVHTKYWLLLVSIAIFCHWSNIRMISLKCDVLCFWYICFVQFPLHVSGWWTLRSRDAALDSRSLSSPVPRPLVANW